MRLLSTSSCVPVRPRSACSKTGAWYSSYDSGSGGVNWQASQKWIWNLSIAECLP